MERRRLVERWRQDCGIPFHDSSSLGYRENTKCNLSIAQIKRAEIMEGEKHGITCELKNLLGQVFGGQHVQKLNSSPVILSMFTLQRLKED